MKRLLYFLGVSFFLTLFACEPATTDFSPVEEPANITLEDMDLSKLPINMELNATFEYGHADRDQLNSLLDELAEDLFNDAGEKLSWIEISVQDHRTTVWGGVDSGFSTKAKGCREDGWTTAGAELCRSKECVRERLEEAYEAAGNISPGQCIDTRTERRTLGAAVCYKVGDC
ncbi:hypothetical protein [Neolewinella agarilytica]|uniref:Lipoprotein n=1 Tax=Neolewinella agarilytica TaxID=478744 RepID=A0A1H9BRE2_9BACT|nr:hypothetical protein [Neolewinella agarilytica]SEP91133.1 hypothetical protein SAMN05444359_103222 [Neolewinella agarilytica]